MRGIGHAWAVIKNLIVLAVILAVFDHANSPSEMIVFCLLVMIYLEMQHFMMTWGKATMETTFGYAEEFQIIRKMVATVDSTEYREAEMNEEILKEQQDKVKYIRVRYWINVCFASVFWIIALLNLWAAIS